jgi:hypothetical protein
MDCNHPLDLPPDIEGIRQQHEVFLTELEALAVQAIASQDWSPVLDLINSFQSPEVNE